MVGVRRLLVTGLSLLAVGVVWMSRVPSDASYVSDLLPACLLAGIALGLCAPSLQIGALSGVADSAPGMASGLVETMREIGGAADVAVVSTVLMSHTGLSGFHVAFVVISIMAALGALAAAAGFPRHAHNDADRPKEDAR